MPKPRNPSAKSDGRQKPRSFLPPAKRLTLLLLRAASDGYLLFDGTYRNPRIAAGQGIEGLRRVMLSEDRRRMMKRFADFRRRGYLAERRRNGRLALALTARGKSVLLRLKIADAPRRSDDKRLIVVFDIPERHRAARAALRHLLRSCGFTRLQDSVWITDRDVYDAFGTWTKRSDIADWVRLFLVEEV